MTKSSSTFLILFIAATSKAQTCNRNGGSTQTFEGECTSRNQTWTEQCIITQKDGMCITTAEKCGCQIIQEDGHSSAVGSGSIDGCDNACVTISDDVPKDRTCQVSGSVVTWEGSCDSRNKTFTSACNFAEEVDDQAVVTKCSISANKCGCLWWDADSSGISGLDSPSGCDACAGPSSGAAGLGLALEAVSAALMGAAWFVL